MLHQPATASGPWWAAQRPSPRGKRAASIPKGGTELRVGSNARPRQVGFPTLPLPALSGKLAAELKDTTRFGKRGEALVLAQLVGIAAVVWPPRTLDALFSELGLLLCVGGLALATAGA